MGNQLTLPQKLQPEHLAEVPKFVLKENLGEVLLCSLGPALQTYRMMQAL